MATDQVSNLYAIIVTGVVLSAVSLQMGTMACEPGMRAEVAYSCVDSTASSERFAVQGEWKCVKILRDRYARLNEEQLQEIANGILTITKDSVYVTGQSVVGACVYSEIKVYPFINEKHSRLRRSDGVLSVEYYTSDFEKSIVYEFDCPKDYYRIDKVITKEDTLLFDYQGNVMYWLLVTVDVEAE